MNRRVAEGPTPASSRRPRQFRLRSLMLLVAAFAFAFATISWYVKVDPHGIALMFLAAVVISLGVTLVVAGPLLVMSVVIVGNVVRAIRHRSRRDQWGPLP